MRRTLLVLSLVVGACTAQVSDLDDLVVNDEACDPRGETARGTDLDLQFDGLVPHINQDMFFAVTVGEERNVEALMVLAGLDDPDLHIVVPDLLPAGPSELAFWADSLPVGMFNPIPGEDEEPAEDEEPPPIDHQWTRPICPNGVMTFKHTTPFQSVKDATSTGAVFKFIFPEQVAMNEDLFGTFHMWVRVILLDDEDPSKELQTRAFFRWAPHVDIGDGEPQQRLPKDGNFQIGGNALGERRGAIDQLSRYRIEFVIDVDQDGEPSRSDYVCSFERQRAPDAAEWLFEPDLSRCDPPDDFDPATFRN